VAEEREAGWQRDAAKRAVANANRAGLEPTFQELIGSSGMGKPDLLAGLSALQGDDDVIETDGRFKIKGVEPGDEEAVPASQVERFLESADAEEERERADGDDPPPAPAAAEPDVPAPPVAAAAGSVPTEAGTVRLTHAMASALDEDTIGKVVSAGIEDAKRNRTRFVLVVE